MPIEAVVAEMNLQYLEALRRGDVAWFERSLAPEFAGIQSDGHLQDTQDFVARVAADPGFDSHALQDARVRVYGNLALVFATGVFRREGGAVWTSRYIDVYA